MTRKAVLPRRKIKGKYNKGEERSTLACARGAGPTCKKKERRPKKKCLSKGKARGHDRTLGPEQLVQLRQRKGAPRNRSRNHRHQENNIVAGERETGAADLRENLFIATRGVNYKPP